MREMVDDRFNGFELNVQELLLAYLRRWWIIVLCLLIGAMSALGVVWKFVTPTYRAKVSIYVSNNKSVESLDYLSSSDISASLRLVNTYISITKSDRVLQKISEHLDGDYTSARLSAAISVEQMNSTEIFCIYADHEDPVEAARIANAAADVAPDEISNLIEGTSARVIDVARVPTSQFSPNYRRAILVGAAVGVAAALIFLTIAHLRDTRVKDENDLTSLVSLPILGRIPNFEVIAAGGVYGYYGTDEKKGGAEK